LFPTQIEIVDLNYELTPMFIGLERGPVTVDTHRGAPLMRFPEKAPGETLPIPQSVIDKLFGCIVVKSVRSFPSPRLQVRDYNFDEPMTSMENLRCMFDDLDLVRAQSLRKKDRYWPVVASEMAAHPRYLSQRLLIGMGDILNCNIHELWDSIPSDADSDSSWDDNLASDDVHWTDFSVGN